MKWLWQLERWRESSEEMREQKMSPEATFMSSIASHPEAGVGSEEMREQKMSPEAMFMSL